MFSILGRIVLFLSFFSFFHDAFRILVQHWSNADFQYSILVPFLSLWMVSKSIATRPIQFKPTGSARVKLSRLVPVLFSLLFYQWAVLQKIHFLEVTFFVFSIWALCFYFRGLAFLKQCRWGLGYLFFLIPVPGFCIAQWTLFLRQISTTVSALVLSLALPQFTRTGNLFSWSAGHRLLIIDACSGLGTVLVMFCLSIPFAFVERKAFIRLFIILGSIPAAVLSNILRIILTALFIQIGFEKMALNEGHSWIGLCTFLFSLFSLVKCGQFLDCTKNDKVEISSTPTVDKQRVLENLKSIFFSGFGIREAMITFTFLLFLGIMKVPPSQGTNHPVTLNITAGSQWQRKSVPVDEQVRKVLGITAQNDGAEFYRYHYLSSLPGIELYLLYSRDARNIVHPPELCYKSEGFEIQSSKEVLTYYNGTQIPAIRMVVGRGPKHFLIYYWYLLTDRLGQFTATSSYIKHQLYSVFTNPFFSSHQTSDNSLGVLVRLAIPIQDPNHLDLEEAHLQELVGSLNIQSVAKF